MRIPIKKTEFPPCPPTVALWSLCTAFHGMACPMLFRFSMTQSRNSRNSNGDKFISLLYSRFLLFSSLLHSACWTTSTILDNQLLWQNFQLRLIFWSTVFYSLQHPYFFIGLGCAFSDDGWLQNTSLSTSVLLPPLLHKFDHTCYWLWT